MHPYDDREIFNRHIVEPWKDVDNATAISRLERLLSYILLRRSQGSVQLPKRTDLKLTLQFSEEERQHYTTVENNVARSIDAVPVMYTHVNTTIKVSSIIQQINEPRLICDLGTYRNSSKSVPPIDNNTWNSRVAQRALNALIATKSIYCNSCGNTQEVTGMNNGFRADLCSTSLRFWLYYCFSVACEVCMARDTMTCCGCMQPCPIAVITHEPGMMGSGVSTPVEWPLGIEDSLSTKVNALVTVLLKQPLGTKRFVYLIRLTILHPIDIRLRNR